MVRVMRKRKSKRYTPRRKFKRNSTRQRRKRTSRSKRGPGRTRSIARIRSFYPDEVITKFKYVVMPYNQTAVTVGDAHYLIFYGNNLYAPYFGAINESGVGGIPAAIVIPPVLPQGG